MNQDTTVHIEYLLNYKKDRWGPLTYATEGSACIDLRAAIKNSIILPKNEMIIIPTGVRMAIPQGYELQIRARSGLAAKHGVMVANSPGTIDSDYRGEIGVILFSAVNHGIQIRPGDRIAQAKLAAVPRISFVEVKDVLSLFKSERGSGGFGSTGIEEG